VYGQADGNRADTLTNTMAEIADQKGHLMEDASTAKFAGESGKWIAA